MSEPDVSKLLKGDNSRGKRGILYWFGKYLRNKYGDDAMNLLEKWVRTQKAAEVLHQILEEVSHDGISHTEG